MVEGGDKGGADRIGGAYERVDFDFGGFSTKGFPSFIGQSQERVGDTRVVLGCGAFFDGFARGLEGQSGAIRAVGSHGIEGIGDGEDAGAGRDAFITQALWVAAAIPAFVMAENNFGGFREKGNVLD